MATEDSSDGDGFYPVGGKKRKKLDGAIAEGESLVENLLQNNKFGPLAGNNNNNDAGEAGAGGAPAVPAPSKSAGKQKQPPLVVKNSTNFYTVAKIVSQCKCTIEPIYKINRFGTKVTSFTVEDFDKLQARLKKHKVEFYTHKRRSERLHRVVLRGLPAQLKPEEVKMILKRDLQLDAQEVHEIKRKKDSTLDETPYIVFFPKGYTNLKKLSEQKVVANTIIRWEAYRNKNANVTQCKNCLLLGHGTKNCHLKARCNKCGGCHKTEECKPQEAQPKRCANCSGAHEAMDRSCPKRADFIRARQQASKPKPSAVKTKKPRPPVPELTPEEFPPLPGVVPGEQNPGGSSGATGSSAGGATKDKADAGGSQDNTGSRGGANPKAGEEEVLYTWEEVWKISLEYSARLKNCKTRSDQVAVISYMARKYGSK